MSFQKLYQNSKMRSVLGIVFILCILISSCAVKFGIKNFLNIQTHSKNNSSIPKEKFTGSTSAWQCNFCKEKDILSNGDVPFSVSDLQGFVAFTFIFLGGAILLLNSQKHPVYDSSKIGNKVPIFLQYRKLII